MMIDLKNLKFIEDFDVADQRVFVRLDLNVPLQEGRIHDDTRIRAALPTIEYLLKKEAHIILASHLGRPKGDASDRLKYSLEPVAADLSQRLNVECILIEEPHGDAAKGLLPGLKRGQLLMLENLRFHAGEEANDQALAQIWAGYTDIYINDAFGASHRAHASLDALPKLVKRRGYGYLIRQEIKEFNSLLTQPPKPFVAILGGAKVSDKIVVIEQLLDRLDRILIGGAMAYTFLAAQGVAVGSSRVERDMIKTAERLLARAEARHKKIVLPVDHLIVKDLAQPETSKTTQDSSVPAGWLAVDIGPKTLELMRAELVGAGTVFWNGPLGVFENPAYAAGTYGIAEAVAKCPAHTIVGGGDSADAVQHSGWADHIQHVSTGGGAALEYLEGRKLPGLEALKPPKMSDPGVEWDRPVSQVTDDDM